MSTPAGWYPDPTGRHQNRWFDGDDWTDQIADGQTVGVDPVRAAGAAGGDATAGGPPPADAAATEAVPAQGGYEPTQATPTTPAPGAGTPPPGAPVDPYVGGPGDSGGGKGGVNKG
ncbi:MAG TPA: DUF2510 domain-containing protein, partial [Acidimicrobiia bacterium]|nr:DUF2510 domain-containing protein [Acidimicrobiia bacterium]